MIHVCEHFASPFDGVIKNGHLICTQWLLGAFIFVIVLLVWISNMPCVLHSFYSFGCTAGNKTEFLESATLTEEEFQERPIINWDAILYVNRPTELWAVQLILALISLTEAMLLTYLGYKVSKRITHSHSHCYSDAILLVAFH